MDEDALGGGEGAGRDGEGDFDGGCAVVVDGDGDEPAAVVAFAGGKLAGLDGGDGEVGEAAIAEDPIGEEPAEVLAGGFFEELFEADGLNRGVVVGEGLVAPVGERLLEGVIAGDGAEHPPDGGGFAAVVELIGGGDEGLAGGGRGGVGGLLGVEAGFGDVEGLDEVIELQEGGVASLDLLDPEEADELGEAFVEPGLAGLHPGVGERVGERGAGAGGCDGGDGSDEERTVFEGLTGVIEDGERCEGVLAKPLLEQGSDGLGGGGEAREGGGVGGFDGKDGGVGHGSGGGCFGGCCGGFRGAGDGLRQGCEEGFRELDDEEAGLAEAERGGWEVGGGEAGLGAGGGGGVVWDGGKGQAAAAEEGSDGWSAFVLDGEAKVDGGGFFGEAKFADGLEELCAVAEEELGCGDGIPEDIAEAAQGGDEGGGCGVGATGAGGVGAGADGVPVGVEGLGGGRADAFEAGGVDGDGAGVDGVEGDGGAGREGCGEGEDDFRGAAGVVGVGVDEVLGERKRKGAGRGDESGAVPDERGGDLERNARERLAAGVAEGDAGAHGEVGGVGIDASVEVVGGEEEVGALGVGERRTCGFGVPESGFGGVFGGGGRCSVALEEDFGLLRAGCRLLGWRGGGRRLGVEGEAREDEGGCEDAREVVGGLQCLGLRWLGGGVAGRRRRFPAGMTKLQCDGENACGAMDGACL